MAQIAGTFKYGHEVTLHATSSPENPFTDTTFTATVTKPDGEKVTSTASTTAMGGRSISLKTPGEEDWVLWIEAERR